MLRTLGNGLGRDRGDPGCLSIPTHRGIEQTDSTTFLPLPLLPSPPFFFLSALEPNANSPGDSFLSVKDENERRKKEGERTVAWRTRQADRRDSEVTERNMGGR